MTTATDSIRLILSCPDRVGIVAAVSSFFAAEGGLITEANHYRDPESEWFFARQVIAANSLPYGVQELRQRFAPLAADFGLEWRIVETRVPKRVIILVSRQAHCLADLLYRWRSGELPCEVAAVVSNHEDLRGYVEWHGIPFHHLPVAEGDRSGHFAAVAATLAGLTPDVVVLARYMQILPPALCQTYAGRLINIHHSFLPAFAGARPYHQAAERGVKLIGATCHYVTEELDAGPIIDQDISRISHHDSVEDMVRKGKDIEKIVLARGLRFHLEDRVLIHGNKTVVFE
ncbi:MAG TPA: formyltetrahydrofolate deformylase [Porticoccaceae bacterium]|nr:formyltetrahydrofolate deformylase [Porticoccaceae bacterium]